MKTTMKGDGTVKVDVHYTHYGHEKDLHHTWLSKRVKQRMASLLASGVKQEKILDDVRDSVGLKFTRLHLLDQKDLQNITRAFGLRSVERHPNDQQSVLSWVSEWKEMENNPVLFIKLQGDTALS